LIGIAESAVGADALVTHDRDFAYVEGLRILS
jgi:hypothetical protein